MTSESLALSALDWWAEAGVDTIVDDAPHDWLTRAAAPATQAVPPPMALVAETPATLADYRRWLLVDASVPGPASARLDAIGDAAHGAMVVVDMPEAGDRAAGALLAGEAGALFDRMLAAIGLDRAHIYLAPFAPARPTGGRVSEADCVVLARLMRHHVALAAPRRLLLLGDAPVRALTGLPLAQARGQMRPVEIEGFGTVPAIASFHPRFVAERPDYRRPAWADLQLFMGL